MRVRILVSAHHPEYRLVVPLATGMDGISANLTAAIGQLGGWEERSLDELDEGLPQHREAIAGIAADGACLWMISAAYSGRVEVVKSGSITD